MLGKTVETFVRASVEDVWKAMTDPTFTDRYLYGARIDSTFVPESPIRYNAAADGKLMMEGKVLEVEAPRRLVHTWHEVFTPELAELPVGKVTWAVERMERGITKISVTHESVDGSPVSIPHVPGGWSFVLSGLKTLVETGEPLVADAPR